MARNYILLALSMSLVGGTVAIAKVLSAELPVFLLGALRCLIAGLALLPWVFRDLQRQRSKGGLSLTGEDLLPIVGQAVFGVFLFTSLLFFGIRSSNALSAGIITSTLPALVALLSIIWLAESFNVRKGLSIALAVFGVAILNVEGAMGSTGAASVLGNGLILLAVMSEAVYTIFAKQSADRLPLGLTAFGVNLIGLICFLPLALPQAWGQDWAAIPISLWGLIAFYAIGSSVFALLLWYQGVRNIPANIAGLFTGFVPLSAGAIAVTLLGEKLTLVHVVGGVLVILAIWFGAKSDVRGGNLPPASPSR
jgi:drug/metabolite transporter (DMT)-like permease